MADSDSMGGKVGIRELGCRSKISRGMMAVITMITLIIAILTRPQLRSSVREVSTRSQKGWQIVEGR